MTRSLLVFKTVNKVCPCVLIFTCCLLSSSSGNIFYTQWLASSTKPPPIFFGLQGDELLNTKMIYYYCLVISFLNKISSAPKPVGRRSRKPGVDRKPRWSSSLSHDFDWYSNASQGDLLNTFSLAWLFSLWRQAYSAKQLDKLEAEFKVSFRQNPLWMNNCIWTSLLF